MEASSHPGPNQRSSAWPEMHGRVIEPCQDKPSLHSNGQAKANGSDELLCLPDQRRAALVVHADEFFRVAIASILTHELDFTTVVGTGSFDEAFGRLGQIPHASLALLDLSEPGAHDHAKVKAMRVCSPRTRIVAVSETDRRSDVLFALASGVHGCVAKSAGVEELTQALRSVLNGVIYVPPSLADMRPGSDFSTPVGAEPADTVGQGNTRPPSTLTSRQRDVLRLLVLGLSNKKIAQKLELSEGTVKVHVAAVFRNFGVTNRAAAAVAGVRLINPSSPDCA